MGLSNIQAVEMMVPNDEQKFVVIFLAVMMAFGIWLSITHGLFWWPG